LASGLAFDLTVVVAAEFERAMAAAYRYAQLKRAARSRDESAANPARQVHVLYGDGFGRSQSRTQPQDIDRLI
jgi:hypothetical protein